MPASGMAKGWHVLVFGDSWADYMHPTWPQVLGQRLSATVHNFAQAGSLCADLTSQAQRALLNPAVPKRAGGLLCPETLIVVHTCGNDFIMKLAEGLMGSGLLGNLFGGSGGGTSNIEILRANPGKREAAVLAEFLDTLYKGGARHFLVSGVPAFLDMPIFGILWPIIAQMVNQGKLDDLGVGPGDPPQLAMQVQAAALHERWSELVTTFSQGHPDAACVFFDEVDALERLRQTLGAAMFDQSMWDMSMFHPTAFGHEQLATEAYQCVLANMAPFQVTTQDEPQPVTLQVRNVKGDVAFPIACDSRWRVARLREAVVAAAPAGFAVAGAACILALKGKFLDDGPKTLAELGITEGTQLIAVMKPAGAKASSNAK